MKEFIRIGVDFGKNYFQIHALESENGHVGPLFSAMKIKRQSPQRLQYPDTRPTRWRTVLALCGH
jgi:hypothetical protein